MAVSDCAFTKQMKAEPKILQYEEFSGIPSKREKMLNLFRTGTLNG